MKVTIAVEFDPAGGQGRRGLQDPGAAHSRLGAELPAYPHLRGGARPHGERQDASGHPRADPEPPERQGPSECSSRTSSSNERNGRSASLRGRGGSRSQGRERPRAGEPAPRVGAEARAALPRSAGETVSLSFARAMPIGDLLAEMSRPIHATQARARPGRRARCPGAGRRGHLHDARRGARWGRPARRPSLDAAGLTAPQTALVARVVDGIVRSFSEVLSKRWTSRSPRSPPDSDDAMAEGAPIACCLEIARRRSARARGAPPREGGAAREGGVARAPAASRR